MKLGVGEMLLKVAEAPKDKKVALLHEYGTKNPAVLGALQLCLDPRIVWALPAGWNPEFKPNIFMDQEGYLHQQMRFMGKFLVNDRYANLGEERRKLLFIQLLEGVAPNDAELLLCAKDKKLPFKLTRKLVEEALPGLIKSEEPK
jgi:hypothetical protein